MIQNIVHVIMALSITCAISDLEAYNSKNEDAFEAVLKKGARLKSLRKNKEKKTRIFTTSKKLIVKARFHAPNNDHVLILDKKGIPQYSTHHQNVTDIQRTVALDPQVDALEVFEKDATVHHLKDGREAYLSHFFSITNFQGKSDFQPQLLGGTETATSGVLGMVKNYFINTKLPLHLGAHVGFYRGSWSDDVVGSSSSQAFLVGPSLMASFFKSEDSHYNAHLHFFQSLRHQMGSDPSPINLSTNGWQLDLEREFTWYNKPFFFAFNVRLSYSKVTSSDQALSGPVESTAETSYGLSFGHRFNWNL